MINKIGARGRDLAGLVRYLFGPGRFDEHRDQRVIAADARLQVADGARLGLDAPTDRERVNELARVLDNHRRLMRIEPVGGWVWRCAIVLPQKETPSGELEPETLSDDQWAIVARIVEGRVGRGLPGLSRAEIERAKRGTGTGPPSRTAGQRPGRTATLDRVVLARTVRAAAAAAESEAEFVRRLQALSEKRGPDCG